MSSAKLKKAIDFIAKRAQERKKSSKKTKDSQSRSDAEKFKGQILIVNKEHQAAIIFKETGVRLSLTERRDLFDLLKAFYASQEAAVRFDTTAEKKAAMSAKSMASTKQGDAVFIVNNFEQAKTLKFKTRNKTDASQIQANYVNGLSRRSKSPKVSAGQISAGSQLGHGDRGVSASQFGIDRAVEESVEKFDLSGAEASRLRSIVTTTRQKYDQKINIATDQYLTSGGKFNSSFRFILSSQATGRNQQDARLERKVFTETINELKAEVVDVKELQQDTEAVITHALAGKKSSNKKVKGNSARSTSRKSKESGSKKIEEAITSVFAVSRGVEAIGIKTPRKQKIAKKSNISLMNIINSQLPQTVMKNMIPPSLENQTGRFASSTRITDITTTRKGFTSMGYTYEKQPYEVFESTSGSRFGSIERDPRRLIEGSIREIAAELAIGRFYTRRV